MSFAILIMNAFTPILNKYVGPHHFGEKKPREKKKRPLKPHKTMKKLSSSFKNMTLSLGIICFSMALVLGAVYQATLDPIRKTEEKQKRKP